MLAIDPGPTESAWVMYSPEFAELRDPINCRIDTNEAVIEHIYERLTAGVPVVVEKLECYGMPVGAEVFETAHMIGRIQEAVRVSQIQLPPRVRSTVTMLPRRNVKLHLCGSARAKDANIRQALIDKFGGKDKAVGSKKAPGPLYKVKSHCWAALALAVTFDESGVRR